MLDPIELDEEQERHAQRMAAETSGAALDASTMSAGKTVVALRTAELRGARQILVTGPLNTRGGWKNTATRGWVTPAGEEGDLADLRFYWIRAGKAGDIAWSNLEFGEPGLYFIGREYATSIGWDVVGHKLLWNDDGSPKMKSNGTQASKVIKKRNQVWEHIHPDVLIVDEVHRGSTSTSTQAFKILDQMHAEFVMGLSGTPHGNRFDGIYPVARALWPSLIDYDVQAFKRRYCTTEYDAFSWDHMRVTGERNPGEFFASLPCVVRRVWEYEGVIDEEDVLVELGREQRKAYDELQRQLATWLGEKRFIIEIPQTKRVRLRQATLGMFTVTDDEEIDFEDDCVSVKLDALHKVLKAPEHFNDEPALIATDSKRFARVMGKRIPGSEVWQGGQSQKVRDDMKQRFIDGELKYIIMVIKAGGTGTDGLQFGTRNVAFISYDDSRIENDQFLARTVRRGQGGLVRIRRILAVDTYDLGIVSDQIEAAVNVNRTMQGVG